MGSSIVVVVGVVLLFSHAPFIKSLRAYLAAAQIPRPTAGQLLLGGVMGVALLGVIVFAKNDLGLGGLALPELWSWFAAVDVATFLDLAALAAIVALTVRLRAVWSAVRFVVRRGGAVARATRWRIRAGLRRRRSRSPTRRGPAADDHPRSRPWPGRISAQRDASIVDARRGFPLSIAS